MSLHYSCAYFFPFFAILLLALPLVNRTKEILWCATWSKVGKKTRCDKKIFAAKYNARRKKKANEPKASTKYRFTVGIFITFYEISFPIKRNPVDFNLYSFGIFLSFLRCVNKNKQNTDLRIWNKHKTENIWKQKHVEKKSCEFY